MGKKELIQKFPEAHIRHVNKADVKITGITQNTKVGLPEKPFDIIKVSCAIDEALAYSNEFLFPEKTHKKIVDVPDLPPVEKIKAVKNNDNAVRVKRKYTKRNKDVQNNKKLDKKCNETQSVPGVSGDNDGPGPSSEATVAEHTTASSSDNCALNLTMPKKQISKGKGKKLDPSDFESCNKSVEESGSSGIHQERGNEPSIPVLEKHDVVEDVSEEDGGSPTPHEDDNKVTSPTEDPEMPELTIAAF